LLCAFGWMLDTCTTPMIVEQENRHCCGEHNLIGGRGDECAFVTGRGERSHVRRCLRSLSCSDWQEPRWNEVLQTEITSIRCE
jgi:hypothetical protein